MPINLILAAFLYVYSQPFFWGCMGFTTATAMFVGVLLYDGNTDQVKKGTLGVLSYAAMILWTTFVRVTPNIASTTQHTERIYAGVATVCYLTIFWLLGILIGVNIFRLKKFKL